MEFDIDLLESEQRELLLKLVAAHLKLPSQERIFAYEAALQRNGARSKAAMEQETARGESVIVNGKVITQIADLPSNIEHDIVWLSKAAGKMEITPHDFDTLEYLELVQVRGEKLFITPTGIAWAKKLKHSQERREVEESEPVVLGPQKRDELKQWAGSDVATVAIVFTDIVDSTALCKRLGDAPWCQILEKHFALANDFVKGNGGVFIKNTGDGVLAVFKNAGAALDFALSLCAETGDELICVRVGAHKGQVMFAGDDVFGGHVNLTARVLNHGKHAAITVTDVIKQDIDSHRAAAHADLCWTQFPKVSLKGFPEPHTLWRVEA